MKAPLSVIYNPNTQKVVKTHKVLYIGGHWQQYLT